MAVFTGLVEMTVPQLGLKGGLFPFIPSTASMAANRASTSGGDDPWGGKAFGETVAVGCRALARGLKMHSILLFRHLRHGPPCAGSHFI